MQGELAHRLVKRLYGLTNKRNIAKQIGNRVQRLERARMARELRLKHEKLRHVVHRVSVPTEVNPESTSSTPPARIAGEAVTADDRVSVPMEVSPEPTSSTRPARATVQAMVEDRTSQYSVSNSENMPINLFELIKSQRGNPAYKVRTILHDRPTQAPTDPEPELLA